MIPYLEIENYKSIKHLMIDCKKVNIFIGEPNTGKSNILEALALFSPGVLVKDVFNEVIRFKSIGDLFFDNKVNNPIRINIDSLQVELAYARNPQGAVLNEFQLIFSNKNDEGNRVFEMTIAHDGSLSNQRGSFSDASVRYYIFKRLKSFNISYNAILSPPFGDNIPNLILGNDELKQIVSDIFRDKGLRLQIKPTENDINIAKEINDEIYSYPYNAISETLQRIIFLMLAIESNKDSVLVFDEPESNTFPFYTKYIAERMALDETNQYFITTHNPYLLRNIIEKTGSNHLNLFITTMENFETKVTLLDKGQVEGILNDEMDVFLNLDTFLGE